MRVRVARTARLPDELRVERYLRVPELGPRILFFSGGTALREVSRHLKRYTHNSIHLITPFDSGGSSATLRDAFGMLSVGDLRNRLMALADESIRGNPEIYELFAYRFPDDVASSELARRLHAMIGGEDSLVAAVPEPMQRIIRIHLRHFSDHMPAGFDLRAASIGNLVLAGGYLASERDIESVLFTFSRLVEARGIVRPVANVDLQLACELADGTTVVGQHRITGKEVAPIVSPIRDMYLVSDATGSERTRTDVHPRVAPLIDDADLICFPYGSFYTSVLANLLPTGIGAAIATAECPKVYVPNGGAVPDPEQIGMGLADSVATLIDFVRRDAGPRTPVERIIDMVLLDHRALAATHPGEIAKVRNMGVEVVGVGLRGAAGDDARLDAEALCRVLLSIV